MYTLMNAFIMKIKTFNAVQVTLFSPSNVINTHPKYSYCWGVQNYEKNVFFENV